MGGVQTSMDRQTTKQGFLFLKHLLGMEMGVGDGGGDGDEDGG